MNHPPFTRFGDFSRWWWWWDIRNGFWAWLSFGGAGLPGQQDLVDVG